MTNHMNAEPGGRELIALLIALVLTLVIFVMMGCGRSLRKENEQLREELAKAQQYVHLKRSTIRDTVEIATQKVVEVERVKEVLSKEDKALLKDLGMKVKELESYQKTGVETRDSVVMTAVPQQPESEDSVFLYKDAWADFELRGRGLKYSVRDSLAIAVKREYKHKFLWWKWGVKGYEVKVANFNPHATVRYNTFVKQRR